MKAIKEKIVSRKINWLALSVLVLMISVVFTSNIVEASIFNWFDDTKSQTEFLNNSLYRPYLKKYNGDFLSQFGIWLGWAVVKGMFTVTDSIQNMIPDVLDLFNFIESTGLNNVYQSVINTIVVGLMILSLMFVGYKMITGKGTIDLRSVGMNIVMSVALILLMPTMISSGIQFAKIFYNDATTITNSDDGVAWSLIKQGVTDLAYINKTDQYSSIDKTEDRNKLTRKNFQQTDLTQVLTDKVIDKLEKENPAADNLRYELVENSNNEFVATKFSDNFLSTFSDSLKSGYYRYQANLWGISIGLTALAIAYVFSAFVIITAILELAFKRVLGVLVFATDIETGQRSKVVLSDILQCYLTVGFQGFGLSMFAMFINFLNAGQGISTNIFIKTIAYICAVFVLIKGSGTVMRYFGVDIGLKEGYGQLASAFGMGAMLFRKGSTGFNRAKGSGNGNGSDSGEGEDRKPEKNFGETLSKKAGKTGRALGYAHERGLSGLASDGATMASERAIKPFKSMRDMANDTKNKFKEGLDDGTVSAINKNSKPMLAKNKEDETGKYADSMPTRLSDRKDGAKVENADRIMSSSERMREAMKNNAESNNNPVSAIQQKVQQDIEERKNAMHGQAKSAEELINQKRQEAKYTPEAMNREEMLRKRVEGRTGTNTDEKEALTKERIQEAKNSNTGLEKLVKENLQNSTSSQGGRSVDVRENIQGSLNGHVGRNVDVRENLQSSSNGQGTKTIDVRENVQNSTSSQGFKSMDVRENVQNSTSSQGFKSMDVRENVQSSTSSQGFKTVDVRENVQKDSGEMKEKTQKINIVEDRKSAKKFDSNHETVIIDSEIRENDKGSKPRRRFTYEDNELFRDTLNDPNPLFDNLLKK
ncbi:pLS20_p028 family conjugation system transmembrane protein [Enterococcus faecium]|uniref:pLS20_p028 family conjugation system transmembrane protein n=1 Tax=Enterococcus faecium TaxID=1352 RepID=UPI000A18A266|nr:TrbC/VirB2 family protein [Enterococcus faecium]SMH73420.1 putative membrane spanning protein [Enterococcus faecium]SMH74958.1 putative membrane spanning protein [Enterococcus faecium]SMH83235.1 putative membrane spanning protein [Enterococcus faecium]SMH83881.1 putative membrane spanning protein [Enterococcus faecium]SML09237.1 putative membrane spanning protein [Enterococcus faecium]